MLIRCEIDDGTYRVLNQLDASRRAKSANIPYITAGTLYRPLAMSVHPSKEGLDIHYLIISDRVPDFPPEVTWHSARKFSLVETAFDKDWEVIQNTSDAQCYGINFVADLDRLRDRLLSGDALVEEQLFNYSKV